MGQKQEPNQRQQLHQHQRRQQQKQQPLLRTLVLAWCLLSPWPVVQGHAVSPVLGALGAGPLSTATGVGRGKSSRSSSSSSQHVGPTSTEGSRSGRHTLPASPSAAAAAAAASAWGRSVACHKTVGEQVRHSIRPIMPFMRLSSKADGSKGKGQPQEHKALSSKAGGSKGPAHGLHEHKAWKQQGPPQKRQEGLPRGSHASPLVQLREPLNPQPRRTRQGPRELVDLKPKKPRLGPQCTGTCCSNTPRKPIPAGTPRLLSQWASPTPANGSHVVITSRQWGCWLQGTWRPGGVVDCHANYTPPVTEAFTVLWVTGTQFQLRTPRGTFVAASPNNYFNTTSNGADPKTHFSVNNSNSLNATLIQSYDGHFLTVDPNRGLWHWALSASAWETFEIREVLEVPAIRGVNLGGWLVYEGWMNPGIFPPRRPGHLMDGTSITFQSAAATRGTQGCWLSVQGGSVSCSSVAALGANEIFHLLTKAPNSTLYQIKTPSFDYLLPTGTGRIVLSPSATWLSNWFQLAFNPRNSSQVLIKTLTGFVRVLQDGTVTTARPAAGAAYPPSPADPAVWTSPYAFNVVSSELFGEWQLAYELGPKKRATVLQRTWGTYMNEQDWAYLRRSGINAVRIPIGYWTAQGSRPDPPFVANSSRYLDWAFAMGNKYGIRIWISMHGAAGSQSGGQNTGTRDGYTHFGEGDTVGKTLAAVEWVAKRYGANGAWMGMGLMNEPGVGVPLQVLQDYYAAAVTIVRKYNKCVFLSMEGIISAWDVQWLLFNSPNVILESHLYSIFDPIENTSAEAEIQRMAVDYKQKILDLQQYGRPLLVGEFSNARKNSSLVFQKQFSLAQMKTLSHAQAGWFFWAYKIQAGDVGWWDFRVSQSKGWLPKNPKGQWY